ncbi:hypothetical protein [uncultured Actinomyces sp.]|uniref:hypothetical protein n=1 Tax=uncultured Actinomyces sp. TaxID=249061 RepID=UPI0026308AAC|nr:hypothetical protein [uncultured Actinomyces sp.]
MHRHRVAFLLCLSLVVLSLALAESGILDLERIAKNVACTNRIDVRSDLGVPGKITGYDCYNDAEQLEYIYRTSNDATILSISMDSWISSTDFPLYISQSNDSYLIANEDKKNELIDSGLIRSKSFAAVPSRSSEAWDTYGPLVCAQYAEALVYTFVFHREELPQNLSSEFLRLLTENYGDVEPGTNPSLRETSLATGALLGNESESINTFCQNGGEIFDNATEN